MNEKTDAVEEIQESQGWTDDTLLTFALRFISRAELDCNFEAYLASMAAEENSEPDNI